MTGTEGFSPRIVIYGTGFVGKSLARFAVEKGWPIVAAFNRAGDKVRQDLGRLAGLDRDIGVIVQDCDKADFSALEADVALVAMTDRMDWNWPAYERLLGAGINVLCHGADCYMPWHSNNRATAEKVDALAKAKGVTFTGSGVWDMSRIWSGILAAGPSVRISSLHHTSFTDAPRQGVHHLQHIGIGMSHEEFAEKIGADKDNRMSNMYTLALAAVVEKLGYTITSITERREPITFDEPFTVWATGETLPPGAITGIRFIAEVTTSEGVPATSVIDLRPALDGEIEHMTWAVEGLPRMEIRVKREDTGFASASSLFNRIPDVLAAPPGIVEITKMGPLKSSALLGAAVAR